MKRAGLVIMCLIALVTCQPITFTQEDSALSEQESVSEAGGTGDGLVIHLPVLQGNSLYCYQGVGGSYSHNLPSTQYDIDLDTSNTQDEEVFAPVSGTAFVHTQDALSGFGYHININLQDGTYIVLAHLKTVFISNATEVVFGQLLGYEGCTGSCTGDHIHVGRHKGDATLPAEKGISVSVSYFVKDQTQADSSAKNVLSSDLVCGASLGHWYASQLPGALWHPNGTLVKTVQDTKVFVLHNNMLQWVVNEQVFWSQKYDFADVVLISSQEQDCFLRGQDITEQGFIEAAFDEQQHLWLFVENQTEKYRVEVGDFAWQEVLASWGLMYSQNQMPVSVQEHDLSLSAWPVQQGFASFRNGTVLKEASHSDVFVVSDGIALPVKDWSSYLLLGFFEREVLVVPDGAVASVQGYVGDCSTNLLCVDLTSVQTCGFSFNLSSLPIQEDNLPTPLPTQEAEQVDHDGDGFFSEATGGNDCWDYNASVYPGATDLCGDGIDQDCTGTDLVCPLNQTDTDGDGVMDDKDNCLYHSNDSQQDQDQDGTGDACDTDFDPELPLPTNVPQTQEDTTDSVQDVQIAGEMDFQEEASTLQTCGQDMICLVDRNQDQKEESVCFSVAGFTQGQAYQETFAYAVGYGLFDWNPTQQDRFDLSDAHLCFDFSLFEQGQTQLTLISSLNLQEEEVDLSDIDDWVWWQNYTFCTSGSALAKEFCVYQGGWNYLLGVSWDPQIGLFGNGDP